MSQSEYRLMIVPVTVMWHHPWDGMRQDQQVESAWAEFCMDAFQHRVDSVL